MNLGLGLSLSLNRGSPTHGPELVTNGTFDTDTTGWSATNSTLSVEGGRMRVTVTTGGTASNGSQILTTEVGATYRLAGDIVAGTFGGTKNISVAGSSGGAAIASIAASGETTFVATATTTHVRGLQGAAGALSGQYTDFDNISVRKVL